MRKFTFLWVPKGDGKILEFRLSPATILLLVLALALGYYAFFHTLRHLRSLETKKNEIKSVLAGNKSLEKELLRLNQKVERLKERTAGLAQKELLLEQLSNLPDAKRQTAEPLPDSLSLLTDERTPLLRDSLSALAEIYGELLKKISSDSAALEFLPTLRPTVPQASVTARFGLERDPFSGKIKPHLGVDFAYDPGTPIFAAAAGTVSFAGKEKGFGTVIRISHGAGWETMYSHLDALGVNGGQKVKKGQRIGTLGNSGRSIGPHLHYEVIRNGKHLDPELLF